MTPLSTSSLTNRFTPCINYSQPRFIDDRSIQPVCLKRAERHQEALLSLYCWSSIRPIINQHARYCGTYRPDSRDLREKYATAIPNIGRYALDPMRSTTTPFRGLNQWEAVRINQHAPKHSHNYFFLSKRHLTRPLPRIPLGSRIMPLVSRQAPTSRRLRGWNF